MKKRMIAVAMTSIMAISMLAGCGGSAPAAEAPAAAGSEEVAAEGGSLTIKDGVLMVGTEIGYPPMEYFDEDGATPIGFDMELAQALADEMGLTLELVDTAWDGIFAGVDTDKYDVILSSVSFTEDRNENYLLSEPYVANAPVVVVPNDSDINDVADLEGKAVSVQMETTADYLMQKYAASYSGDMDIDLRQYEKVINAMDELTTGRVDACCTDSVVAAYYLGDDAANYRTAWTSPETEPIVMCFKKGNDGLNEAMTAALNTLRENGKLAEISEKYFGSADPINLQ